MWGENGRLQFHCTSTDVHRSQPASGWDSRLAVLSCHRSSVACCRRLRPFRSRQTTVDLASHIPAAISLPPNDCRALPSPRRPAWQGRPRPLPPPLRLQWRRRRRRCGSGKSRPLSRQPIRRACTGWEALLWPRARCEGQSAWAQAMARRPWHPAAEAGRKPAPTACAAPPPAGRGFTAHWTDRRHVRACCAARPALPSTAAGASRHASPALCTSRSRPRLHPPAPVAGASSLSLRRGSSW